MLPVRFFMLILEPGETVYVDMPLGFNVKSKNGKRQVLKLNKTLYGLRQSPRAFWKYITEKLGCLYEGVHSHH